MPLSRLTDMNAISHIATLIIQVLTIPINNFKPDALATITTGMGEKERIIAPVQAWNTNDYPSAQYLLIAGANDQEKYYDEIGFDHLVDPPYNLSRLTARVICQPRDQHKDLNTKGQMEWLVRVASQLGINCMLLYAPPYHITRAYLTLLKVVLKTNASLIVAPKPLEVPPSTITSEMGVQVREMIPGEIRRIQEYQNKGDVATLEELEYYIDTITPIIYSSI